MAAISYSSGAILEETIQAVRAILGDAMDEFTVEQAVIGVFFTGVKLNNGQGAYVSRQLRPYLTLSAAPAQPGRCLPRGN